LSLLLLVGLVALIVAPVSTTFNVTARTERLEMKVSEQPISRWYVDKAEIFEDNNSSEERFSGSIELAHPVTVMMERVAYGDLWIHIECIVSPGAVEECHSGILYSETEDRIRSLKSDVDIYFTGIRDRADKGETILLPVSGEVMVGRTSGIGTTAILRSGKVSMLGRSVFRSNAFEAGSVELNLGDRFHVTDIDPDSTTLGFVLADQAPGLTAAYRIVGSAGSVTRPGGGMYTVTTSVYQRFLSDTVFRVLAGILITIAAIAQLGSFVIDAWNGWKEFFGSAIHVGAAPTKGAVVETGPDNAGEKSTES
jgi:hypothetical protein